MMTITQNYEDFLTKDKSFTINHEIIETLEIEMFQVHYGLLQVSFLHLFYNCKESNLYSLRSPPDFQIPRINTAFKGTEPYDILDQ